MLRCKCLCSGSSVINILNSLEQMGYKVVTSGAFVASQSVNNNKVHIRRVSRKVETYCHDFNFILFLYLAFIYEFNFQVFWNSSRICSYFHLRDGDTTKGYLVLIANAPLATAGHGQSNLYCGYEIAEIDI